MWGPPSSPCESPFSSSVLASDIPSAALTWRICRVSTATLAPVIRASSSYCTENDARSRPRGKSPNGRSRWRNRLCEAESWNLLTIHGPSRPPQIGERPRERWRKAEIGRGSHYHPPYSVRNGERDMTLLSVGSRELFLFSLRRSKSSGRFAAQITDRWCRSRAQCVVVIFNSEAQPSSLPITEERWIVNLQPTNNDRRTILPPAKRLPALNQQSIERRDNNDVPHLQKVHTVTSPPNLKPHKNVLYNHIEENHRRALFSSLSRRGPTANSEQRKNKR